MPRKERQLRDWLDSFLLYTDNSEPVYTYRLWTGVSTIASCLQRKCPYYFRPERIIYPNFYVVLVGNSGTRKNAAIIYGKDLMKAVGVTLAPDSTSREKLMKEMFDCGYLTHEDSSVEILEHHSLTLVQAELAVFLRVNDPDMLLLLTKFYDCEDDFSRKTLGGESYEIGGTYLNLLGGITPTVLKLVLPATTLGIGLTARMMFIYAHSKGKAIADDSITQEELRLREKLIQDLEKIKALEGNFTADSEFKKLYKAWYEDTTLMNPKRLVNSGNFDGYVSRRQTHLQKLAMVCSASRGDSLTIKGQDFLRALDILLITEKWMPETFIGISENTYKKYVELINNYLFVERSVLYSDLYEKFYREIDQKFLNDCLKALIQAGNVRLDKEKGEKKLTFKAILTYIGRRDEND